MTTRRTLGAFTLLSALVTATAAAGPELIVGTSCDNDRIGGAATVTVPITFRAAVADNGQPNAVSALDFAVTFAPDALSVSDVRPTAALDLEAWSFDWQRTLGLPETPGRVTIAIAPQFNRLLPTLPDGPIAELVLTGAATGQSRCVPIEIPADSVQLSKPPLGTWLDPGPVTGGGVTITEMCQDCADNDGDGLVDLADPDCGAKPLAATQMMLKRTKRGSAAPKMTSTIGAALEKLTGPVRLTIRPEGVEPATCLTLEAQVSKSKRKRNRRTYVLKNRDGKKVAKLESNLKKARTSMKDGKLTGLTPPLDATSFSVSLWLGDDPFYATITCKKQGKAAVVCR